MARSNRIHPISHAVRPRRKPASPTTMRARRALDVAARRSRQASLPSPPAPSVRPPALPRRGRASARLRLVVSNQRPRRLRAVPRPTLRLVRGLSAAIHARNHLHPPRMRGLRLASGAFAIAVALAAAGLAAFATSIGRVILGSM